MKILEFVELRQKVIKQLEDKLGRKLTDEEWFICSDSIRYSQELSH